jgi:DNA repair protein RadC
MSKSNIEVALSLVPMSSSEPVLPATPKRKPRKPRYTSESRTGFSSAIPGQRLMNAFDVWNATSDLRNLRQEHFIVFDLDVRHRVIERRTIGIGSLTGVEVHPREVFRGAIINSAAAVILVHNHPSGDPNPSRQDVELTTRLRSTGDTIGIPVLDHVIVGTEGFVGMSQRGWV